MASPTGYVALLRGVNVGGANRLAMKDLAAMCEKLGYARVKTFIQSGNVVFQATAGKASVQQALETALARHMGKPIAVIVRDRAALSAALERNPFRAQDGSKVLVIFCADPLPRNVLDGVVAPGGEQVFAAKQEIYVYYPEGMGRSKLKLPKIECAVTARNVNTVARLVTLLEVARLEP
jgi:uncharacterized protein (DUF1697 family)